MNTENIVETTTASAENVFVNLPPENIPTITSPPENVVNETVALAPTPTRVKPTRSDEQKKFDSKNKAKFAEIKALYAERFKNLPADKQPKPKYPVAVKASHLPEEESKKYVETILEEEREWVEGDGKYKNIYSSSSDNKSGADSVKSMVNTLQGALDIAVEDTIESVMGAATTSGTRRAAKRFVDVLKRSTQKLKQSLKQEVGDTGNSVNSENYSNSVNSENYSNSTNKNSPYKTRAKTILLSNNSGMVPKNSLAEESNVSAMDNSVKYNSETTTVPEVNSLGLVANSNSKSVANSNSLNLNMSNLHMNSNSPSSNSVSSKPNSNERSYKRIKTAAHKAKRATKKRRRNTSNSNSGYTSNSNSRYTSNSNTLNNLRNTKRQRKTTPPISGSPATEL